MSAKPVRFDNRVAIVTGSGRGLGREHALLLGRLGASVVVNSMTAATAQSTADDITRAGGKATVHIGSVADKAVADALVKKAIDTFGRVDIVINNAGYAEYLPFESLSHAQLTDMLNTHIGGAFNVTQAAWPHMQKQKYGRVVMISSHAIFGMAYNTTYSPAKLGVVGLAKSLACEGKPHNIHVNAVATTGYSPSVEKNTKDEQMKSFLQQNMPPSEPARMVAWLSHEDCVANGEVFGAQGRVATKIFLAETHGFQGSRDGDWSVETIRDNWDQIVHEDGYHVYASTEELGNDLFKRIAGA